MPAEDFDALVRAARWTALSPYLDHASGEGPPYREPVASPFHGGVCVESYQLVPILKALRMPPATPHNGHTRSFTGLLEMLDPVRFTRTSEMTAAMRGRVEDVVVRRLKREINAGSQKPESAKGMHSLRRDHGPRLCTRHPPAALPLEADSRVLALSAAFDAFRAAVRKLVSASERPRRRAGTFAVEILGKRLLSCPTAFAESWSRARQGFMDPDAEAAAERAVRQETGDDREAERRAATATTAVGAWLRNFADDVSDEIGSIERALAALGFVLGDAPITDQAPVVDTRFEALVERIERLFRTGVSSATTSA